MTTGAERTTGGTDGEAKRLVEEIRILYEDDSGVPDLVDDAKKLQRDL